MRARVAAFSYIAIIARVLAFLRLTLSFRTLFTLGASRLVSVRALITILAGSHTFFFRKRSRIAISTWSAATWACLASVTNITLNLSSRCRVSATGARLAITLPYLVLILSGRARFAVSVGPGRVHILAGTARSALSFIGTRKSARSAKLARSPLD